MRVGFVGIGAMGRRMIPHLVAAGHEVHGFARSSASRAALEAGGGHPVVSAYDACRNADALVLMVLNAQQAAMVLFESAAASALPQGALVLSSVTMEPEMAASFGGRIDAAGLHFLDAPVSGGTAGAEAGTLTFMASGSDRAFDLATPLMEAMGSRIFRLGTMPGAGSQMKMINQLAAGCHLAVAAETISLASRLGLDPKLVLEILGGSAAASWMITDRGNRLLGDGSDVRSAVDVFTKDLSIVADTAEAAAFRAPMADAALNIFRTTSERGFGRLDDSQITRFYEPDPAAPDNDTEPD